MSPCAFVTGLPVVASGRTSGSATCERRAARRCAGAGGASMMADEKAKNPLGGLGGLGNIMDAFKKAQEFTSVAKDLQEQLRNTEIEASVRDGAVKVTMNAQQVPLKVEVSDDLVAQGSTEVSAAVTECVIAAHLKSSEYMKEKMGSLTKEFGIPQPPPQ